MSTAASTAARDRIEAMLDEGSFVELGALGRARSTLESGADRLPGDGVVTGHGTVDGRRVIIFSQCPARTDGSLGEAHCRKIATVMDLALTTGRPLIGIIDGTAIDVADGMPALSMFGNVLQQTIKASGVIPQIAVVVGPSVAALALPAALADFVVMVDRAAWLTATDPELIATVTGEQHTGNELGGAGIQVRAGTAHLVAESEMDAFGSVRDLLSYLPSNNQALPPSSAPASVGSGPIDDDISDTDLELNELIPASPDLPYDMHEVIVRLLDDQEFLELQSGRADNILVGFGRVDGHAVGIVANQPMHLTGCLDIDAAKKAARFVRTCNAFNLPVITLVDVPGFVPSAAQELDGLLGKAGKLLHAYGEATVGKITVVIRKAYGAAYHAMGSKQLGADVTLAWPMARIAPEPALRTAGRRHGDDLLAQTGRAPDDDLDAARRLLQEDIEGSAMNPVQAAERGDIDAVISPSLTRVQLAASLGLLRTKMAVVPPKKLGNIPL